MPKHISNSYEQIQNDCQILKAATVYIAIDEVMARVRKQKSKHL